MLRGSLMKKGAGGPGTLAKVLIILALLVVMMWFTGLIGPAVRTQTGCQEQGGVCKTSCAEEDTKLVSVLGCPEKNGDATAKQCCKTPEIEGDKDQRCNDKDNGYKCDDKDESAVCYNNYCVTKCKYCSLVGGEGSVDGTNICKTTVNGEILTVKSPFECRFMEAEECDALGDIGQCVKGEFCTAKTKYCAGISGTGAATGFLLVDYRDNPIYVNKKEQFLDPRELVIGDALSEGRDILSLTTSFTGVKTHCAVTILSKLESEPDLARVVFPCGKDLAVHNLANDFFVPGAEHLDKTYNLQIIVYDLLNPSGVSGNARTQAQKLQELNDKQLRSAIIPLSVVRPSAEALEQRQPKITIQVSNAATKSCIVRCSNKLGELCRVRALPTSSVQECGILQDWNDLEPLDAEEWSPSIQVDSDEKLCLYATLRTNDAYENYADTTACENLFYTYGQTSTDCGWSTCAVIPNANECHTTITHGCSFQCVWDQQLRDCHLCGDPTVLCGQIRSESACEGPSGAFNQCRMQCHWVNRPWPLRDSCRPGP